MSLREKFKSGVFRVVRGMLEEKNAEIVTDSQMIRVNGPPHGFCVARFGPAGAEVCDQEGRWTAWRGGTLEAWRQFQADVWRYHRIVVDDQHMPATVRARINGE